MPNLDKRIDEIEKKLNVISGSPTSYPTSSHSGEIDLRELFVVLWRGKWWIVGVTFLFVVLGVGYALSLPNMYKSEGIYAPAQKEGASGGLGSQFGGLAAVAGINIGVGESQDVEQALAVIKSWPFIEHFIQKHKLEVDILGVEGWDKARGEVIWNDDVYDPDESIWLEEASSYKLYRQFREYFSVSQDSKTGLITISVEYFIPEKSARWVNLLSLEINEFFRMRDVGEAEASIKYLENKIAETGVADMHAVFYKMIESQTKTLMLAEVSEEYLIRTVVPPKIAENKSKPKRALLVLLSIFLGGGLSSFFYLAWFFAWQSGRAAINRR